MCSCAMTDEPVLPRTGAIYPSSAKSRYDLGSYGAPDITTLLRNDRPPSSEGAKRGRNPRLAGKSLRSYQDTPTTPRSFTDTIGCEWLPRPVSRPSSFTRIGSDQDFPRSSEYAR